jgi:hypothetical protein
VIRQSNAAGPDAALHLEAFVLAYHRLITVMSYWACPGFQVNPDSHDLIPFPLASERLYRLLFLCRSAYRSRRNAFNRFNYLIGVEMISHGKSQARPPLLPKLRQSLSGRIVSLSFRIDQPTLSAFL